MKERVFFKMAAIPSFDPNQLDRNQLASLANSIEEYLMLLEEVMIFPEELEGNKKEFMGAIKITKKLIKKLRDGDKSVFKSYDEEE